MRFPYVLGMTMESVLLGDGKTLMKLLVFIYKFLFGELLYLIGYPFLDLILLLTTNSELLGAGLLVNVRAMGLLYFHFIEDWNKGGVNEH